MALQRVVFPEEVPPETSIFFLSFTALHIASYCLSVKEPFSTYSSKEKILIAFFLMLKVGF